VRPDPHVVATAVRRLDLARRVGRADVEGGIIIPETAKEKPQKGTVIAVGPGTEDEKMEVKKGDVVLYGKYSGTELTIEGKDYLIMKQSEILAVV
jgi:chaperonin GroES